MERFGERDLESSWRLWGRFSAHFCMLVFEMLSGRPVELPWTRFGVVLDPLGYDLGGFGEDFPLFLAAFGKVCPRGF